jgi:hypothetical protein
MPKEQARTGPAPSAAPERFAPAAAVNDLRPGALIAPAKPKLEGNAGS